MSDYESGIKIKQSGLPSINGQAVRCLFEYDNPIKEFFREPVRLLMLVLYVVFTGRGILPRDGFLAVVLAL